jgi:hypothetical protein
MKLNSQFAVPATKPYKLLITHVGWLDVTREGGGCENGSNMSQSDD